MVTEVVHKRREEFGDMPKATNLLITFLNNKNRYQLDEIEIDDRIATIIEIKKVLTKRNLMLNLEKRCESIQADIDSFMTKYGILREKGLPSPMAINDKMMTQEDYIEIINKLAKNQVSTSGVKSFPTGKVLYDSLENLFYIEHEVKQLFTSKPNFSRYTKADEIYRKMVRMKLAGSEWWTKLIDLL